jgi:hypothetical protein
MDKPLPNDFDPVLVVDEPVQEPAESSDEDNECDRSPSNDPQNQEDVFPMHFLPPVIKRFVFAGSCCTGVAVLGFLSSWDHDWIPGLSSQLAKASDLKDMDGRYVALKGDVAELYVLSLARAIRDLSEDNCTLQSATVREQIDALQLKYKARTGDFYRHSECKKGSDER